MAICAAHTHFVRDDFDHKELLGLNDFAAEHWNPEIKSEKAPGLAQFKFLNYVKEMYYDSDTQLALLTGAPFDDPTWWLLSNAQIVKTRDMVNDFAGSRRLLAHTIITPKQPGWMDEVDMAISTYKPDSWKGYTIGDPLAPSKFPWRLDDEALMYPFYEKAVKAGITTVCVHKGLLPPDYEKSFADVWKFATADDIGKAAKDWPQINFVIYHSALRPFLELPDQAWAEFEASGRIKWTSDLADIPAKYGVTNVYGDLGTSFANSAVAHPKFAAGRSARWSKASEPITSSGVPTQYGMGPPNGRSKRCGGSRFLKTCRRNTALHHSAAPTARSSKGSLV